jgi:chromosome segregation ATPase
MLNILEIPAVLAALAFTGGYVLAKLGSLLGRRSAADAKKNDAAHDKQMRGVEADLRVTRKTLEQAETELEALREERNVLREELDECRGQLKKITAKASQLGAHLQEECEKTQSLRTELKERAEHSIRAQIQIRDMETELNLGNTSTGNVQVEIDQLIAERDEPNERLDMLKEGAGGGSTDDQQGKAKRQGDAVLDG